MSAEQREAIVEHIESGAKDADMGRVGMRLDHIVVDEDGDAVPWRGYNMRAGLCDIIGKLAEFYPVALRDAANDVIACSRGKVRIMVLPGGQIAFYILPHLSVGAIADEYRHFSFRLDQILKEAGYAYETVGYHPGAQVAQIGTVPAYATKERQEAYASNEALAAYEKGVARLTISIEFADGADAVRKMRILQLLGPVLGFLGANMPQFEGDATTNPLASLVLKRAAYPQSGASVPGLFDPSFSVAAYADWAIGLERLPVAFGQEDLLGALDAVQTDVSWDRVIRIDVADALPPAAAFSLAALVKGLVYSPLGLDMLEQFLCIKDGVSSYGTDDVEAAISAIGERGFEAQLYGRSLESWIDLLYRLAPDGLGTEAELLEDLKEFKGL